MTEYAQGGYITGPASDCTPVFLHPDECYMSAHNVRARRWVCSRPDHDHTGDNLGGEPRAT